MNFYIADSIAEVKFDDVNIGMDDELVEYLYVIKKNNPNVASIFYYLDPYGDVELQKEDIEDLIGFCRYILEADLLQRYEEKEEAVDTLNDIISICLKAIKEGKNIVSIGD